MDTTFFLVSYLKNQLSRITPAICFPGLLEFSSMPLFHPYPANVQGFHLAFKALEQPDKAVLTCFAVQSNLESFSVLRLVHLQSASPLEL